MLLTFKDLKVLGKFPRAHLDFLLGLPGSSWYVYPMLETFIQSQPETKSRSKFKLTETVIPFQGQKIQGIKSADSILRKNKGRGREGGRGG